MKSKKPGPTVMIEDGVTLGTWIGRRQAFAVLASRCTAADAECLKTMRAGGEYKKLGLTWAEFCKQRAGISRTHADRLIQHLEEFGPNYFRLSELVQISSETYRLIEGAISEDGIVVDGQAISLTPENRSKVVTAVEGLRHKANPLSETLAKRLDAIVRDLGKLSLTGQERLAMIGFLDERARAISNVSRKMRAESPLAGV